MQYHRQSPKMPDLNSDQAYWVYSSHFVAGESSHACHPYFRSES